MPYSEVITQRGIVVQSGSSKRVFLLKTVGAFLAIIMSGVIVIAWHVSALRVVEFVDDFVYAARTVLRHKHSDDSEVRPSEEPVPQVAALPAARPEPRIQKKLDAATARARLFDQTVAEAGRHYGQGTYARSLTKADLAHGEAQVKKMIADRPIMARYVSKGDRVWTWTVRQFAGEGLGVRIFWNNEEPECDHVMADNRGPYGQLTTGRIRIRRTCNGRVLDGEEHWSAAIFELFNVRGTPEFNKIDDAAFNGKIDRDAYIRRTCQVEFQAELLQTWFYRNVWLQNAQQKGIPSTDNLWGENNPPTFREWFAAFNDQSRYPFHCYGDFYEKSMVPYANSLKTYQKALEQYEQEVKADLAAGKKSRLAELASAEHDGQLFFEDGFYNSAAVSFETALSIREQELGPDHPDLVNTLNYLGLVYSKQQKYSQAMKYYTRAIGIRIHSYGSNDLSVADSLRRLASVCAEQGDQVQADKLLARAAAIESQHPVSTTANAVAAQPPEGSQ